MAAAAAAAAPDEGAPGKEATTEEDSNRSHTVCNSLGTAWRRKQVGWEAEVVGESTV